MHRNLEVLAESRATPSALLEAPARPSLLTQLMDALKCLAKQHRDRRVLSHLDTRTLADIGLTREICSGRQRYYPTLEAHQ